MVLDNKTKRIVFENNFIKFKSDKCFGKLIVQYSICKTGNMKLIKKTKKKNKNAKIDFFPLREIDVFFLIPLLVGVGY